MRTLGSRRPTLSFAIFHKAFGYTSANGQGSLYVFNFDRKTKAWNLVTANLQPSNRVVDPGFAPFGQSLDISKVRFRRWARWW